MQAQAIVLAAGHGKRLQPLTDRIPKPAVPVVHQPLGAYALSALGRLGATRIAANTYYRAGQVREALSQAAPTGVVLRFSNETELLGTGGGIQKAWREQLQANEPVFVANGDIIFEPNAHAWIAATRTQPAPTSVMVLRKVGEVPNASNAPRANIGVQDVQGSQSNQGIEPRVYRVIAVPGPRNNTVFCQGTSRNDVTRWLAFSGFQWLSPNILPRLPESGCVIREGVARAIEAGERVVGVVDDSRWADLGSVPAYHEACIQLATGAWPWPGLGVAMQGWVSPTAHMHHRARVTESVVGDEAYVGETTLHRCVVWPGARIDPKTAELSHKIVVPWTTTPISVSSSQPHEPTPQ